ncbi:MAG: cytochrome c-type biosis protein CcmH [Solirubrobacteraceae bacterium]|jgi:cytochrome c-type biogenesis protein CcmH|nr:cytochrome c-type biosis protein CcmH [Solirubrobacteraceae bacterium]
MRHAAAILAVIVTLLAPAAASAATPRASLPDIENEVMCTTCKIPLNVAESAQADQIRDFIRVRITKGETKAQIKSDLVAAYGRDVLALPDKGGFGLTAYVVPLALIVLLAGTLLLVLPRWRRRTSAAAADPGDVAPALSRAEARRLDDDLARYEQ